MSLAREPVARALASAESDASVAAQVIARTHANGFHMIDPAGSTTTAPARFW